MVKALWGRLFMIGYIGGNKAILFIIAWRMAQRNCCCDLLGCLAGVACCCECNKFIFPAPQSDYKLGEVITGDDDLKWSFLSFDSNGTTVPYLEISNGASRAKKKCFIYFHGNGEDLGTLGYFLQPLVKAFSVTFFAIEYPSYGQYYSLCPLFISSGIKQDALAFYDYIKGQHGRKREDILVMGRSIGSGGATYLAARRQVPNLVLMSPFDTIRRVARAHMGCAGSIVKQHFNNIEEIVRFQGRVLVIHGQRDQVIGIAHARNLVQQYEGRNDYKNRATFVEPKDMTHNNFSVKEDIFMPMKAFLEDALNQ